jgi:hypothetical protein
LSSALHIYRGGKSMKKFTLLILLLIPLVVLFSSSSLAEAGGWPLILPAAGATHSPDGCPGGHPASDTVKNRSGGNGATVTLGYVYTNNDDFNGNTVTTFKVNADGSLTNLGNTSTGGLGTGGGFFASNRLKTVTRGLCLLGADDGSNDIAIFSGADTGSLSLIANVPTGDSGTMGMALVAGGSCLVAGFSDSGNIRSYKLLSSSPYLALVSTVATGGSVDGMAGTKSGTGYYVAAANANNAIGVIPITPSTCALGSLSLISSSGGAFGGVPTGVAFNTNGTIMYIGDANGSGTVVEACPFPGGPCTAYSYSSGGVNSNTVLVDKTDTCLFASNNNTPGVTAIPLSGGIPGASSTFTSDGTGNSYSGRGAWHNTYKGFFLPSTSGTANDVDVFSVGSGCAVTLKGSYATSITDGSYLLSVTTSPAVDP